MPWTARDAFSHTRKANTPALQARWATVANDALSKNKGDEAAAIRIANAAIDGAASAKPKMKPKRKAKERRSNPGPEHNPGPKTPMPY